MKKKLLKMMLTAVGLLIVWNYTPYYYKKQIKL